MAIQYAVKPPSQVPTTLAVYKLAPPQSTTSQVAAMSQQFGLSGKMREFITNDEWTSYQEGRYRVSVHRNSGAVRYLNRDKYGIEPKNDFKISPTRTEKIATDFLGRTRAYPANQSRLYRITNLRSGVSDIKGKEKTERLIDAGVIYRRLVDDIPVDGPGGYAMVNIDPDGEVVGMRSVWRQTAGRETKVKIIPVGQAIEAFERTLSKVEGKITVTAANFGYFEQGELDRQSYLEPAYVFIYVVQNGAVAHKSIEVIAAGDKTFAKLKGSKRFDPAQQMKRDLKTSPAKPGKKASTTKAKKR
jgi:hypothetical protein